MKAEEVSNNKDRILSDELKHKLLQALDYPQPSISGKKEKKKAAIQNIGEIKQLLYQIKEEAENLRSLFWSQNELEELKYFIDLFEIRIQNNMQITKKNLDWYENQGWKKFIDVEDDSSS